MPARDLIHDAVKTALIKDGWVITDDPYVLELEEIALHVDLAGERLLAPSEAHKIAVDIKSFASLPTMHDLASVLGQHIVHRRAILRQEPDRKLYIAIQQQTYRDTVQHPALQKILQAEKLPLLVVDDQKQEVLLWIN